MERISIEGTAGATIDPLIVIAVTEHKLRKYLSISSSTQNVTALIFGPSLVDPLEYSQRYIVRRIKYSGGGIKEY